MIIARSPFRISFFGGGTDFPEFFRRRSGAVLLTAINRYCYISVHRLCPLHKHRFRASYSRTELVASPGMFKHPLIRESLLFMNIKDGLEITHIADLPGRTGLGTSSAFTVALLNALHAFAGERVGAAQLAAEAVEVERVRAGEAGGVQDQYAAAFGGFLRIEFGADGSVTVENISAPQRRLALLRRHLLMFYLGSERVAAAISRDQRRRIPRNEEKLGRLAEMARSAARLLAGAGPLAQFGEMLDEAWRLKRSLSPLISTPAIDAAYETAKKAGALGGKLLGAGGCGFLLLFAPPQRHGRIRARLRGLQELDFEFAREGSKIVFNSPE